MRAPSSERSFKLCAFSVFKARICQANSVLGAINVVMALAPSRRMASSRWLGRPKPAVRCRNTDYRIQVCSGFLDDTGEFFVVSFGQIALKRCRFDRIHRKHGKRERRSAQWIPTRSDNGSTLLLDTPDHFTNGFG